MTFKQYPIQQLQYKLESNILYSRKNGMDNVVPQTRTLLHRIIVRVAGHCELTVSYEFLVMT